jgi:hypothetical protein
MRDKSPDPDALIRAGRAAFRPEPSDRERVLQSLTRTLGAGAVLEGSLHATLSKSLARASLPVRLWLLGGLGALAVGGMILAVAHPWTKAPSQTAVQVAPSLPTSEPGRSAVLPPSANADDRAPEPPRVEGTPRPIARPSVAPTTSDSLNEEVRVLSRAEQQLNAGHADDALKTLAEHERRFPGGALTEERMAARVQCLCALGRTAAAKADLAKLAQAYPRSPYLDRARRFCGFDGP